MTMAGDHHLFSPSSAHRWIPCAPAVAMGQKYAPETSYDAAEGTVAHRLASTCLQAGLDATEVWAGIDDVEEEGHTIRVSVEMRAYVQGYLDYVRAIDGGLEVEQRMEFAADPDFGGTGDALVWQLVESTLHVIDLKYGKGIKVFAEGNPQCLSYGVLAIARNSVIDVDKVKLHIYQPRMNHIDTWEVPVDVLVPFARTVAKSMIDARRWILRLNDGQEPEVEDYTPGEHCTFCPHRRNCIGLQQQAILSAQAVFSDVTQVPTSTIEQILDKATLIQTWLKSVFAEAETRALAGEKFDHHKLVYKQAARKWVNVQQVEEIALDNLIEIHETVVLTPPALEKKIGEKALNAVFNGQIHKVSSGLTLVAADDRREAVDPQAGPALRAQLVFSAVESNPMNGATQ
jgi:hypothetical protein